MSSPAKAAKASPTHAKSTTSPSKADPANGASSVTEKLKESLNHTKEIISEGLTAMTTAATHTAKQIEDVISDKLGHPHGEVADDKENASKQSQSSPKNAANTSQADKAGDGTLNVDGSVGTVATEVSAVVDKSFADPAASLTSPSNVPVTVTNDAVIGAIEPAATTSNNGTEHTGEEAAGSKRNAAEGEEDAESVKKQKTGK